MVRKNIVYLLKLLTLFIIYFSFGKLGLTFDAVSGFATLIWIPSGIALASLLLFGYRLWPGIAIGAFFVNFLNGAPLFVALGICIGNTLEAVFGVFVLRLSGFNTSLDRIGEVIKLATVSMAATVIAATIGVTSLLIGNIVTPTTYVSTWQAWWIGDMISILIITPFILTWSVRPKAKLELKRIPELCLFVLLLIFVVVTIHSSFFIFPLNYSPQYYLVFLPIIWAALRFGQRGTTATILILITVIIIDIIQGSRPFPEIRLTERLLILQAFMVVTSITALILAAVDAQRRELEERKDEFINLASHELKTPVTSIKAFAQLLQKNKVVHRDKQANFYLEKIHSQIDNLSFLINDLLDISKIQANKFEFKNEYFSFSKLVKETIDTVQATTMTHCLIVKERYKKNQDIVYADKDRIGQAIINLLSNAIKYSVKDNRVIIKLKIEKENVVISIRDFGVGISQSEQNKIFQRYYRVSERSDATASGLGIGLYITNEIVKHSHGKLWIKSKVGRGTIFYLSLPIKTHGKYTRA